MHPPTGCYGAPPQQQSYPTIPAYSTPVPNKAPITNSANYYQSNHQQQQQQHHVAPSPYTAPSNSAPAPSQSYATHPSTAPPPPSNAHYNQQPFQQQQQQPPYATPGSYYGQQSYHAPPAQQPSLVPAPAGAPGAPVYPIVSYPSAPGSSQYGTLSSSQSISTHGGMPTQMGAPLHHYSSARPVTAVQPGYSVAPPNQMAPTVNGQGSTGMCEGLMIAEAD